MIYDVEVVTLNAMKSQKRTTRESWDLRVLLETHLGRISVQEHREETSMHNFDVARSNALKNQRTQRESGDMRVLL